MKTFKYISTILLGVIFLFSSTGFLLYKSLCSCTGNESISIFIKNEICSSTIQDETDVYVLTCCNTEKKEKVGCSSCEGTQCSAHSDHCECDSPQLIYVKLNNLINNEEVKYTEVKTTQLILPSLPAFSINLYENNSDADCENYIEPPPQIQSSLDFLIQIHQLKIPALS